METRPTAVDPMASTHFSPSLLAELYQPQVLLEEPEPHTKLGQQVRRLEQKGRYKAAGYVKTCGRLGEKWTYACGRSSIRKIIRSHFRFCCSWCDQYVATRLFEQHRGYRERLHPAGTLHRLRVRSSDYPISSDGVRDFEATVIETVRLSFAESQGWGLKFWTDYEEGCLVARGIIYLPPGASLPSKGLQIRSATCSVGKAASMRLPSYACRHLATLPDRRPRHPEGRPDGCLSWRKTSSQPRCLLWADKQEAQGKLAPEHRLRHNFR